MKKFLIFTLVMLQIFNLTTWFDCRGLKEDFHLSKERIALQLDDAIHNDVGIPTVLIRSYHNKPVFYALELSKRLLWYFDINFLLNLISVGGLVGVVFGIINLWKIIFYILLFNLVELIFNPKIFFPLKLLILTIPYFLLSLSGYRRLLNKTNSRWLFIIVFVIILLTVWWQMVLVKKEVFNFCQ